MRLSVLCSVIFLITTQAPGTDSFQSAGSLLTARADHNAVLLNNGKVLIVGGAGTTVGLSSAFVTTAELYDPAAGTLTTTGVPLYHHHHATLTLLPSGKVLFAGGISDYIGHPYPYCPPEIYDPATGTWSAAAGMQTTHFMHTATLLQNGKVLVVGTDSGSGVNTKAELYDPVANTWTTTGSLTAGRQNHTATLLPSGKLLVVGGTGSSTFIASAEIYDPSAGTWSSAGTLTTGRYNHTATLLPNGKVLVSGGSGSTGTLSSSELYDPGNNSWSTTGALASARYSHQAALLPNGKVLAAGGRGSLTTAEIYDPATGTWSTTTALGTGRSDATATLLPGGGVVFAGGGDSSGNAIASIELFTSATPAWSSTGTMTTSRNTHTGTLLPSGKVLVAGGASGSALSSAELYDIGAGTWSATGSLSQARMEHTANLLPNGKVLVAGGYASSWLNSAELYDPAAGTWSSAGTMSSYRHRHTATSLRSGQVLVAGGGSPIAISNTQLYNPSTGTWSSTGSLNTARLWHTASALPNGKVLVTGGCQQFAMPGYASCELYDPAAGTWTNTGSLATGRYQHTATLLPSGKVLVVGGWAVPSSSVIYASAEIFDPATGTWSATGSLAAARYGHTATLLPNGRVLVAGGKNASVNLSSAEVYDPISGTWSTISSMSVARYVNSATLLTNGKILVAGAGPQNAEIFDSGLGFAPASQPQITTVSFDSSAQLVLAGSGFSGISGASSGAFQDSSTSYPMVLLSSIGNEQMAFLQANSGSSLSSTAFTCSAVTGFPPGQALATVFANGIPGTSVMVVVPQPQSITVEQPAGTGIANGGSKAFASTLVAATQTLTFTVKNSGGLTLNISGVSVTGGNAADFAVSTSGMSSSLSSGSSTTFTVSFTPSALGARSTTLQIISDDSVAPTYSISLSGTGLNNSPTITGLSDQTINEDGSTGALSFTIGDVETAAGSLTLTGSSSNTTMVPNANIVFGGTGASRTVTVAPAANQNGTATITVTVGDGTTTTNGTFVLTVSAVNDPPTLSAISNPAAILEDAGLQTVSLSGITAGPNESQTLTVTATSDNTALIPNPTVTYSSPSATGSLSYTPVANANGTATITVTVNDGQAANNLFTQTFIVTVTAVNDPPTLDPISNPAAILEDAGIQTINLTGITAGPANEVQTLIVTATSSNTGLIPNPSVSYTSPATTGALSYTPVANANGSSVITVTVNDGQAANNTFVRTFTVNVTAVNDPPTISAILDQTINEDGNTGPLAFTLGDVETAAASLTVTGVSSNKTLVPDASLVFGGSGANRTLTATPAANASGTTTITLTVSDGTTTSSSAFLLTVTAVNDAPTITDITDQVITYNTLTNGLPFTIGDIDTAVASLTVTASSSNLSLVPNENIFLGGSGASRTVTVVPGYNQVGTTTITVTVSDGALLTSDTFVLTVNAPDIVVEQPFNTSISSGGTKDFGSVLVGGGTSLVFYVKNITASNLTGLNLALNGADAAMFTILSTPVAPVAGPNGATAFTIRFNPTSAGAKTAAIHLSSNDPDENPFDITLTGTGMSALDSWRQTNFGSLLNAGNAANTADPDHDGIPNLLEYAFGSNPLQNGGSLIPKPQFNGSTIVFSFAEPSGVSGASYAAEWSRTLDSASWSTSGFNDSGSGGSHVFTLSVNPADGPMFVRIRVSQP